MSFDLYFVSPPAPGETWGDVMDRFDVKSPVDAGDAVLASRLLSAVSTVPADGESFDGELFTDANGEVLFSLFVGGGEDSVNAPYSSSGERAAYVVERLVAVARAVELETGLIVFDPQAGVPFLDGGSATAVRSFDQVAQMLSGANPGVTNRSRLVHLGQIVASFAITAFALWVASLAFSISVMAIVATVWFGSAFNYEVLERRRRR